MAKLEKGSVASFQVYIVIFLLLFIVFPVNTHTAEKKNPDTERSYVFSYHPFSGFAGIRAIDMMEILDNVIKDINKNTSIKIVFKNISGSTHEEEFRQKKADFAMIAADPLLKLRQAGIELEPLAVLSMSDRPGARVCAYTKGNYKDIKSLKGARASIFGYGSPSVYIVTRKLLAKNGIDMPLDSFFEGIYKIQTSGMYGSVFQALILDKIDVVFDIDWSFSFYSKTIPQMEIIKPVACTQDYAVIGIMMRKGLNREDIAIIQEYFYKLHKNPVLGELRTLFIAFDAGFIKPNPVLFEKMDELFEEAEEKGWLDEAMVFAKKMEELDFGQELKKEEKTYKECKKQCVDEEDWETCIDECMGE